MRHDILNKIFIFSMAGIFTLLNFSIKDPELLFLLPMFIGFIIIIYFYNLSAKSTHAAYLATIEHRILSEYPEIKIPMPETFQGTYSERNRWSRNFKGVWALRTIVLPIMLMLTILVYMMVGEVAIYDLVMVCTISVLAIIAIIAFIVLEAKNAMALARENDDISSDENRSLK